MADLETIIELREDAKAKEPTNQLPSPTRKENPLQPAAMTSIQPAATNPGHFLLGNKSVNGGEFTAGISLHSTPVMRLNNACVRFSSTRTHLQHTARLVVVGKILQSAFALRHRRRFR